MTNKQRMQTLLDGGIPDVPPTWELVFQIEKEFFGHDFPVKSASTNPSPQEKAQANWERHAEIYSRLVEELGWAVIYSGYDPAQVAFFRKRGVGERALLAAYEGEGVFWMPNGENMMDFAIRLFERPAELHAEARRKCDKAKDLFTRHVDAGADFLVGTWDFGFNNAPFISPEHFRQFVTPYMAELVDHAHHLGVKIILHSDGCLWQVFDQIHSTGIDGYQSVDPQGQMDIRKVRQLYPDWLLMGNVACNMLQDTNEQEIRKSVRYCMEHGGIGKRYVFSTSNCIFEGMPPQSYRVMLDEYHRLCRS